MEADEEIPLEMRVLVVDDEPLLAKLNHEILEVIGCSCFSFSDPLKALAEFEENPEGFNLIVTDQTMPGLTGSELAKRAKSIRPEVHAIVRTGHSDLIDEDKAAELGLDDILLKPVSMTTLQQRVRSLEGSAQPPKLTEHRNT